MLILAYNTNHNVLNLKSADEDISQVFDFWGELD